MASLTDLSTEEIKKELEKREGALSGLYARRDELEKELAEVNERIAGEAASPAAPASAEKSDGTSAETPDAKPAETPDAQSGEEAPKKRRGRPPGSKNKPKTAGSAAAGRKRPKNDKPLPAVLADVLGGRKGPTPLDEIYEAVVATGYKTASKNFKNVIYQNLYNKDEFTKTGDGWVYKP